MENDSTIQKKSYLYVQRLVIYLRYLIILILFCQIDNTLIAKDFFCISEKPFVIPELTRKASINANFKISFSVSNLIPENIYISGVDSFSNSLMDMFNDATLKNLNTLSFFRDSSNCVIYFKYEVKSNSEVNYDFAEIINKSEIRLVFKRKSVFTNDESVWMFSSESDTLILKNYLVYPKPKSLKSNILVERIFGDDKDSTIIRINNYPELEDEIFRVSKEYSKNSFLLNIIGNKNSKAKWFFIRFYLQYQNKECNYEKIF